MTKVAWNKGLITIDWDSKIQTVLEGRFKFVERIPAEQGEAKLIIRCTKCGDDKTVSSSMLRGTNAHRIRCSACFSEECRKAREEKKEQERMSREFDRLRKRQETGHQMTLNFCSDCGRVIPFRSHYCDECLIVHKRMNERRKEHKRRLREGKTFDRDITLEELYQRDNGVCYLCGKHCDWSDCQWKGDTFIVGKTYPTVEHIIALVNGGSHTWDNIKLACHSCNSKKGYKRMPLMSEF